MSKGTERVARSLSGAVEKVGRGEGEERRDG